MSASHTDITSKTDKQQCVQAPSALNLRDLLSQHKAEPVVSSNINQNFPQENAIQAISSGTSLAQLMSQHEHESKTQVNDISRNMNVSPLNTFTVGCSSPSSAMSSHSLSLGTLASLNMSSAAQTSSPFNLSVSLSNLSLNGSKSVTGSTTLAAPPGFESLTSVLHNSQHLMTDPKGGPSLADLIHEHSNHSPVQSSSLLTPLSAITSVKCEEMTAAAQTLSLSELASQHQNKSIHSHSQSTQRPANVLLSSDTTNISSTCLGGPASLSQLALQHQNNSCVPHTPASSESQANALKQQLGLSKILSLSHLATEHKGKTSTTSNGSQCNLTSLLSPAKPESADVFAESTTDGGTECELNRKPYHQISRASKPTQTVDLSALMAQANRASPHHFDTDLPSPSSPTPLALGLDFSVFAKPSVFAVTLSFQSRRQQRRRRNVLRAKLKDMGMFYQSLLCKSPLQDKSKKQLTPLLPIVPFCFDTPSPDDIVRANQRKAFTR